MTTSPEWRTRRSRCDPRFYGLHGGVVVNRTRFVRTMTMAACGVAIVLAAIITATLGWRPLIGPRARTLTNRTFARTPERLNRGRYLVQSVDACLVCHSP